MSCCRQKQKLGDFNFLVVLYHLILLDSKTTCTIIFVAKEKVEQVCLDWRSCPINAEVLRRSTTSVQNLSNHHCYHYQFHPHHHHITINTNITVIVVIVNTSPPPMCHPPAKPWSSSSSWQKQKKQTYEMSMNVHCASLYKYLDISYLYTLHRHHQQYQTHQHSITIILIIMAGVEEADLSMKVQCASHFLPKKKNPGKL